MFAQDFLTFSEHFLDHSLIGWQLIQVIVLSTLRKKKTTKSSHVQHTHGQYVKPSEILTLIERPHF